MRRAALQRVSPEILLERVGKRAVQLGGSLQSRQAIACVEVFAEELNKLRTEIHDLREDNKRLRQVVREIESRDVGEADPDPHEDEDYDHDLKTDLEQTQ